MPRKPDHSEAVFGAEELARMLSGGQMRVTVGGEAVESPPDGQEENSFELPPDTTLESQIAHADALVEAGRWRLTENLDRLAIDPETGEVSYVTTEERKTGNGQTRTRQVAYRLQFEKGQIPLGDKVYVYFLPGKLLETKPDGMEVREAKIMRPYPHEVEQYRRQQRNEETERLEGQSVWGPLERNPQSSDPEQLVVRTKDPSDSGRELIVIYQKPAKGKSQSEGDQVDMWVGRVIHVTARKIVAKSKREGELSLSELGHAVRGPRTVGKHRHYRRGKRRAQRRT